MANPWVLFEEALAEVGDKRRDCLQAVIEAVSACDGTEADRAELVAAAKAELARAGALTLAEACVACAEAESFGRAGWSDYYLAEAASALGRPDIVLARLARIPPDFFRIRELAWRDARCQELEALAHLELGDWARTDLLVDELAAAYALRGDADDFAPPRDLVAKLLLDMPRGFRSLAALAASLDLDSWLDPTLAGRVHAALDRKTEGGT